MRILIPVFNFTSSGGSRVLSQFANYWIKAGHEVTFLCLTSSPSPYFPTAAEIKRFDLNGCIKGGKTDANLKNSIMIFLHLGIIVEQRAMIKALNELSCGYDIVLANHALTAWPVHFSNIKARKFYYIQAYEADYFLANKNLKSKLLAYYCGMSYGLNDLWKIVNSPTYYSYKRLQSSKFVTCGIDLSLYYPKEIEKINFSKAKIKFGVIGRPQIFKGTTYALEAYKLVRKRLGNKVELHIAFGSAEFANEELGIFISEPHGDSYLADYYREMDIVLAPGLSQYGAVHYPVIEAMACGTPIVTTYYLPANESNAWLVEPGNVDNLAATMMAILTNVELACQKRQLALQSITSFDWNVVSNKMLNYFQTSIQG